VIANDAIRPDPTAARKGTEGRGFSAGTDGQDGGDTTFGVDGAAVLVAGGGKGGRAGTGVRLASSRLSVSALMLVNYAEGRDLAYIVGGGWQSYSITDVPARLVFPLFILFEAGGVGVGEFTVGVEARDPNGTRRAHMNFPLTVVEAGDVVRISRCCDLSALVESFGVWTLAVTSPQGDLAQIDLLIKRSGEA
jgi:hypothetical protein